MNYEQSTYCYSLKTITIGDSVTSIGEWAFEECISLTSITVDENNEHYKSIDGNLYSKDGTTLIQYAIGKEATSFKIPDTVTSIGFTAFEACTSLASVIIPDSVISIGDRAFAYCTSLASVTIGNSVTSIGTGSFAGCTSLTTVILGNSMTSIGEYDKMSTSKGSSSLLRQCVQPSGQQLQMLGLY